MQWQTPPKIKIYEALGAVADDRIEVSGNQAKVYSSSGNKYYDVAFDPKARAIMTNDNGSYWKGYLGYPAIAFLLKTGFLPYRQDLAQFMKAIAWKDLNTRFNNDFDKTISHIFATIPNQAQAVLECYAEELLDAMKTEPFTYLGKKRKPPSGY